METTNTVTDLLKQHMHKQLLLHAAGTWMFCPKCNNILDWSTVIILDIFNVSGKQKGNQVVCTSCTKDLNTINWKSLETDQKIKIEVTSKDFSR